MAQSGGADVHDRMSALGIAAEEIGRASSVKSDVRDPKLTLETMHFPGARCILFSLTLVRAARLLNFCS